MDLWAQIRIPLVTAAVGWFGYAWRYRRERLDKLAELQQQSEEVAERRRRLDAELERDREADDRGWIDKAAELCRSSDPQERQHGRGFLHGLAAMGDTNPRVVEILDQLTQSELGQTVAEIREAERDRDVTVEVVEEVVVSDDLSAVRGQSRDGGGGLSSDAAVEAQEGHEAQEDQGDAGSGRHGPGAAGG